MCSLDFGEIACNKYPLILLLLFQTTCSVMCGYFLESVLCLLATAFTYIAGDAASIIASGRPLY